MKNNIREILDKTNISIVDEFNILEYIDELEQIKEEYTKSLDKLDELENRLDKAIDYIEVLDKNEFETIDDVIVLDNYLSDLLDILRGEDNGR